MIRITPKMGPKPSRSGNGNRNRPSPRTDIARYGRHGASVRVFIEAGGGMVRAQWRDPGPGRRLLTKSWPNLGEYRLAAAVFAEAKARELDPDLRIQRYARRAEPQQVWVYVVRNPDNGLVKIGVTTDLGRRLRGLSAQSGSALELVASWPGCIAEERDAHIQFLAHRVRGEWFSPSPELLAWAAHRNGNRNRP